MSAHAALPPGDAARGAYVATAAGCATCHGDDYAGGYALPTGFGTFHVPNITPDADHGIGSWTAADFTRAIRKGKDDENHPLYPAFPYTSYAGLADQDVADLWAFLQAVPASPKENVDHEILPKYRSTCLLRLWRDFEWNRPTTPADCGAYLVEVVGHCGECHTPRNGVGKVLHAHALAGNGAPPEPSPNITPHPDDGIGSWTTDEIVELLADGLDDQGMPVGHGMKLVVKQETSQLTDADRAAIAAYLQAVKPRATRKKDAGPDGAAPADEDAAPADEDRDDQ